MGTIGVTNMWIVGCSVH